MRRLRKILIATSLILGAVGVAIPEETQKNIIIALSTGLSLAGAYLLREE